MVQKPPLSPPRMPATAVSPQTPVTDNSKTPPMVAEPNISSGAKRPFWVRALKIFGIILIVFVVLAIVGAAYVVSASGLKHIPGLSGLFYQTPQPTRTVTAEELNLAEIKKNVAQEISTGKDTVQVNITENNLSSIIASSIRPDIKLENSQVALINSGQQMEIFGKLLNSEMYLTAVYDVGKDSSGRFEIKNLAYLKAGKINVPNFLISWGIISDKAINSASGIQIISDALADDGTGLRVENVELAEGKIVESVSQQNEQSEN